MRQNIRLKLGQCERFEQSLWRNDDSPHLIVDTRETGHRFVHVAWSPDDRMIAVCTTGRRKSLDALPTPDMRTYSVDEVQAVVSVF